MTPYYCHQKIVKSSLRIRPALRRSFVVPSPRSAQGILTILALLYVVNTILGITSWQARL